MSILVVGSVAYDCLETPAGRRERVLGGSATHFSAAASFFAKVHLVGVVGGDFEEAHLDFLRGRGVDLAGLKVDRGGKTFFWSGHYLNDLNRAETLSTELGVFATFDPELSAHHRERPYLFLANIHPALQLKVLEQMTALRFVAVDTMNLWITTEREMLERVIARADLLFVNDGEAKLLTGESNVVRAARAIGKMGPRHVVVKRGEHGALLFAEDRLFAAPALPLAQVVDPTGAGDTFAGGFLGYVARQGDVEEATLRRAVVCGNIMASFQVEDFGPARLAKLAPAAIEERFEAFRNLSCFEAAPIF